jgi:hypothetical protein
VTVKLLSNDLTLLEQAAQAGFIIAIFIPFRYFLDDLM